MRARTKRPATIERDPDGFWAWLGMSVDGEGIASGPISLGVRNDRGQVRQTHAEKLVQARFSCPSDVLTVCDALGYLSCPKPSDRVRRRCSDAVPR
jgi:hypothetical protein